MHPEKSRPASLSRAFQPRLNSSFRASGNAVILDGDEQRIEIVATNVPRSVLERTLRRLDGETKLADIVVKPPMEVGFQSLFPDGLWQPRPNDVRLFQINLTPKSDH